MNRSLIIAAAVLMLVTCAFAQSDSHPECGNAVFFGGAERGATSTSSDASLLDGFNTVMERVSASKRWFVWMKVTVHDFNLIDGQDPLFTLGSSEGQDVQFALNPVGSFSWQQRHEDRLYSNRASSLQDALRAGEEVDLVFEVVYDYNTAATAFVNGADITTRRHRSPAEYVLSSNPTITLNGKASNAFTIHDSAMFTDMVLNDFLDCANGIPPTAFVAGATATVDSWGLAYGRVWNMDAADMDNDGDLDLVVVRYGANGVSPKMIVIYVNDNGSFSSENVVVVDSNIGRASIRFYDYNNDRNIDIVAGSRTDNKVVRYTNNGDLSFTATVLREFDNPVMDIAITENSPNALVLNEGVFEFREGAMRETGGCGTTPFSLGMGRVRPNNPNSHIIVNDRSSKRVCYIPNHSNDVPLFLNKAEDVGATKVMFSDVNGEDSVVVSEYLYINSMRRSLYAHPVNGGEDVEYVSAEEGAGDFHTVRLYASGRDSALVTTSKTEFAFWNQDGEKTVIRDDLASLESPKPYNLIRGYDVDGDGDADIVTFVMDGVNREYRLEVITNDSV